MARAMPAVSTSHRRRLYKRACTEIRGLMQCLMALRLRIEREELALMTRMAVQAWVGEGRKAQGLSLVLRQKAHCYMGFHRLAPAQNFLIPTFSIWYEGGLTVISLWLLEYLVIFILQAMSRLRGVPRRGGRTGTRVILDDLYPIPPISAEPPSSSSSEQECLLPQGTYQTFRFRFPSRLVRPEVVVTFTVFISEEDPERSTSSSPSVEFVQDCDILLADQNGVMHRVRGPVPQQAAQDLSGFDAPVEELQPLPFSNAERNVDRTWAPRLGSTSHAASVEEVSPPPASKMEVEDLIDEDSPIPEYQTQHEDDSVIWLGPPSPDNGRQEASSHQPI